MRGIFYQKRDFTTYFDEFCYQLVRLVTDLLIFFLGLTLLFGGIHLEKYENAQSKEALQNFLKSFTTVTYETVLDFTTKVPEGVSVHHFEEVDYRTYNLKASAGKYTFEGTLTHGRTEKTIQYLQTESFWEKGVVLTFFGEVISILGLLWFVAKRAMGIKSLREFHREDFIFGDYR